MAKSASVGKGDPIICYIFCDAGFCEASLFRLPDETGDITVLPARTFLPAPNGRACRVNGLLRHWTEERMRQTLPSFFQNVSRHLRIPLPRIPFTAGCRLFIFHTAKQRLKQAISEQLVTDLGCWIGDHASDSPLYGVYFPPTFFCYPPASLSRMDGTEPNACSERRRRAARLRARAQWVLQDRRREREKASLGGCGGGYITRRL